MSAALDFGILGPAVLAGLVVLATHVPLGREVLRRGIIFLDLAVAQIAALGVIAAHSFDWEPGIWQVQTIAAAAALAGAWLLSAAERRFGEVLEAVIGLAFVLAASAGILLLAANPHGGEHLKELLAGQILWVTPLALVAATALSALVLGVWFARRDGLPSWLFYTLFALSVTASVQLVGVYLVFASLILPALAVRRLAAGPALAWGYGIGVAGYAAGIAVSALTDLPTGPVIVLALTVVAAGTTVVRK
jgi:zinc/manganese transport system permease protein